VSTLLEPGDSIVVRRTIIRQKKKNVDVDPAILARIQEKEEMKNQKRKTNGGLVQPVGNAELPVLGNILKEEDFPRLG